MGLTERLLCDPNLKVSRSDRLLGRDGMERYIRKFKLVGALAAYLSLYLGHAPSHPGRTLIQTYLRLPSYPGEM